MGNLKVIGLRVEKYIDKGVKEHNNGFEYCDDEFVRHILCCRDYTNYDGRCVEIEFSLTEGECPSGWTTASWANLNYTYVKNFRTFNYIPIKVMEVDASILDEKIYEFKNSFIEYYYDGGDSWYPCGNYYIDMKLFRETVRIKNKRPVWIFKGDSNAGKTYLSSHLDMEVYETDSSPELPKSITESIIVLGNKYDFDIDDIKKCVYESDNTEFHIVDFKID